MKLNKGDILQCGPEDGCGLKVVVIEVCDEEECDLKCCGKDMNVIKQAGSEIWKQFVKEADEDEAWKKYADGKGEEKKV